MTKPLSSHLRDGPERVDEILDATTYSRVTVLYCGLRNGQSKDVLRRIEKTPPRFHHWFLNEHGAYCNDREMGSREAKAFIRHIKNADEFVGYERGPAKKLWPGDPYHNKPSWSGGGR